MKNPTIDDINFTADLAELRALAEQILIHPKLGLLNDPCLDIYAQTVTDLETDPSETM